GGGRPRGAPATLRGQSNRRANGNDEGDERKFLGHMQVQHE
ncbi:MAG: hypothetical protein ACJAUC_003348, partial [Planctomycetota bacterium]